MRCYQIVVKEGRRRRYIGFRIKLQKDKTINLEKKDIVDEIKKQSILLFDKNCRELGIYLIRFNGEKGIVKCNHTQKDNTIQLLKSINKICLQPVKIETLGTSGTIKALVKKHMS